MMTMFKFYDRDAKPLADVAAWAALVEKESYRRVKADYTPDKKFFISTVWLGIDHDFTWDGHAANPNPLIFETMVFDQRPDKAVALPDGRKVPDGGEMRRTSTIAAALEAHKQMLERYTVMEEVLDSSLAQNTQ